MTVHHLVLHSPYQEDTSRLPIVITITHEAILIEAVGHGVCGMVDGPIGQGHRPVIAIEHAYGVLKSFHWADINQEDPTHVVEHDNAKFECRKDS